VNHSGTASAETVKITSNIRSSTRRSDGVLPGTLFHIFRRHGHSVMVGRIAGSTSLFNEMIRNGFAGYMLPNAHKRVPIIDMRKDVGECFAYAPLNEECDRSSKGLLVEFDEVVEVGDSGKYLCHAPLDESACMGADCA